MKIFIHFQISKSIIYENEYYSCVEYIKIGEKAKLGIKIYKYNDTTEERESSELFFFIIN